MADTQAESRTARLELVWGTAGLARAQRATVAVFGCGGVGSSCIEALARGGVGRLIIVDGDEVAPSNINRQAIAFTSTLGRRKVEVMAEMVRAINPDAEVIAYDRFIRADDVETLMENVRAACEGQLDYVVDAVDTVSTKLALAAWADQTGTPLISSMGGAYKLDPEQLRICDIYETARDPLARVMRKGCRKRGIRRLTVLASFEEPRELPIVPDAIVPDDDFVGTHDECSADGDDGKQDDGSDRRHDVHAPTARPALGTVSYLPPIMGQMIAGHVIRALVFTDTPGSTR